MKNVIINLEYNIWYLYLIVFIHLGIFVFLFLLLRPSVLLFSYSIFNNNSKCMYFKWYTRSETIGILSIVSANRTECRIIRCLCVSLSLPACVCFFLVLLFSPPPTSLSIEPWGTMTTSPWSSTTREGLCRTRRPLTGWGPWWGLWAGVRRGY